MQAYCLYEKSPKNAMNWMTLRQCLEEDEIPAAKTRGNRPLQACRTRFLSHKVTAINSFIERHGTYINYLTSHTEDQSVKPVDK